MNHSSFISMAQQRMKGFWPISAVAYLLYSVIVGASSVVSYFLIGPLEYGLVMYLRKQADEGISNIEMLFSGFNRFLETMIAGLLQFIFVCIGMCLFFIPGIIVALGLSMTFYIMADEPNISGVDALKKSWEMMKGYKMDLLMFYLRFIGWWLLSLFTCGIGAFFLMPYVQTAQLYYYRELKARKYNMPPQN